MFVATKDGTQIYYNDGAAGTLLRTAMADVTGVDERPQRWMTATRRS
jgi:hypothetical protein